MKTQLSPKQAVFSQNATLSIALLCLTGCLPANDPEAERQVSALVESDQTAGRRLSEIKEDEPDPRYNADIYGTDGEIIGKVTVRATPVGVDLDIVARGLRPGTHALHLHQVGRCEAPDFKSAGGHFNPTDAEHGTSTTEFNAQADDRHVGDMRNQTVDRNGNLNIQIRKPNVTISALALGEEPVVNGRYSLMDADGTTLIVHAEADDYTTQPAGDSGTRVACAVIAAPRAPRNSVAGHEAGT